MPETRVRKPKKARWQLILGVKQIICGALGLTWMMVIIFILGVLAGRGDVYRWLSNWGLVSSEAPKSAQWSPPPEAPPAAPAAKAPAVPPAAPATAAAPAPSPPTAHPAPVPGSITGTPSSPSPPGKKAKKPASPRDLRAKEDDLRRMRREVAPKLKFQNSFDTPTAKPGRAGLKQKDKDKHATAATKPPAAPMRVVRYRDAKSAKAKLAELQKKGEKVSLKQGKDHEGAYFDIVRQAPPGPREVEGLAQKTPKSTGKKPKPRPETGN